MSWDYGQGYYESEPEEELPPDKLFSIFIRKHYIIPNYQGYYELKLKDKSITICDGMFRSKLFVPRL